MTLSGNFDCPYISGMVGSQIFHTYWIFRGVTTAAFEWHQKLPKHCIGGIRPIALHVIFKDGNAIKDFFSAFMSWNIYVYIYFFTSFVWIYALENKWPCKKWRAYAWKCMLRRVIWNVDIFLFPHQAEQYLKQTVSVFVIFVFWVMTSCLLCVEV